MSAEFITLGMTVGLKWKLVMTWISSQYVKYQRNLFHKKTIENWITFYFYWSQKLLFTEHSKHDFSQKVLGKTSWIQFVSLRSKS